MNELVGEFHHKLDAKARLSLPSKIRSVIGEVVIVTRGLDGCGYVYSQDQWGVITEKLSTLSLGSQSARAFNRFILSSAVETSIDKSVRILVPETIRDHAGLADEVVIAGVGNRLELWNPADWQNQLGQFDENIDELAEKLADIGAI